MAENALVPVSQYAVVTMDQELLREVFQENLSGNALGVTDLDRVKFPSGGSTFWTVPGIDGDTPQKFLEGVVIYHKDSRVYFDKPFDESNGEPPTCYSDDAITGYMLEGDPEEGKRRACSCATCPFAQWDSAEKGKGQACSMNKNFFMITKDSVFPIHVRIPAGSYKVAQKDFLVSVTKSLVPYYGVIAKFGLVEEKNPQGIKYAKLKVEEKRKLDPADAATFKAFHEQFKPMLSQVRTESASFTTDGDGVTFGEGQEVGGGLDLE